MDDLMDVIWIELRKALRSRIPLWTALGSLFLPLGIAFLIFVARNPEISQKLGLISAKADLLAFSAIDWSDYLNLYGQLIAAGGFILFTLVISWVFGREFADGTLKDLLAVPVQRAGILLAKFIVVAIWCFVLAFVIMIAGLAMAYLVQLPGISTGSILQGGVMMLITVILVILSLSPFALLASVGRGYLLPIGIAVLALMTANLVVIAGWGEYFPWAVPGLYAQGKSPLPTVSYWIVLLTALMGMFGTYLWWKYADQSR